MIELTHSLKVFDDLLTFPSENFIINIVGCVILIASGYLKTEMTPKQKFNHQSGQAKDLHVQKGHDSFDPMLR